jgi:1-aminocyclopropane-1-carboxylate deaminase/D-cysteine desulfhydrase-like pyridoxal-dependent ACC family enzyme
MHLGNYPTNIERIDGLSNDASRLWIKRDDATNDAYGGNKVRKLELLLEEAAARGARRIMTFGAVGSHHVLATTVHGKASGFEVAAVLTPQPFSDHACVNLQEALSAGLEAHACEVVAWVPWVLARAWRRGDYLVPPGGSNVTGSVGYAKAAIELAQQVSDGVPAPDVIVVALGSGGTVAGLVAGLEETSLPCPVHAVRVVPAPLITKSSTVFLARGVARHRKTKTSYAALWRRCEVVEDRLGRGYGYPTSWGEEAMEHGLRAGVKLEATYTAKAFSHALRLVEARTHRNVLYWHTLSGAKRRAVEGVVIPPELERLWR